MQDLLDALLKITAACSAAEVELPEGLAQQIYDLGLAIAVGPNEPVEPILDALKSILGVPAENPAVQMAVNGARTALGAAQTNFVTPTKEDTSETAPESILGQKADS
jgi:hypothetical protein